MKEFVLFTISDKFVFITVFSVLLLGIAVLNMLFDFLAEIIKMAIRANNIKKHGYPPPHCDADGDAVENE